MTQELQQNYYASRGATTITLELIKETPTLLIFKDQYGTTRKFKKDTGMQYPKETGMWDVGFDLITKEEYIKINLLPMQKEITKKEQELFKLKEEETKLLNLR